MKLIKWINILLIMLLTYSCSIMPMYDVRRAGYCRQESYDTVCGGYDAEQFREYNTCSAYDDEDCEVQ